MERKLDQINGNPTKEQPNPKELERLQLEQRLLEIDRRIKVLDEELAEIERSTQLESVEEIRAERMVTTATENVEEENDTTITEELSRLHAKIKDSPARKQVSTLLGKIRGAVGKALKRKIIRYAFLPFGTATGVALAYHTPQEYYDMAQNWKERHLDKYKVEDPTIKGIDDIYKGATDIQRTTYDFLGTEKVDYKSGYYMTSVFDLSDRTPPQFKMINDRHYNSKIDDAAGITTNLFKPFYKFSDFKPQLKGHLDKSDAEKGEVAVIGYNTKTGTMRAGHYKEFNDDWMVSETYEIPLNFKLNEDGTVNLVYHDQAMRMVPQSINERGIGVPFPIGITYEKTTTKINPREATRFGTLEGGKVVMVCGDKQLQVNGSFADMFHVYERLQKDLPGVPIQAYLLDNGSYNLPIWNKNTDGEITPQMIREHMDRNRDGGTALVLMNDGAISPYEYKNKYQEIEHHIEGDTLDAKTGKPAKNEHSVIVIHHTGNYADPQQIIREFEDPKNERSAHVLILKDGTRHIFNNDNSVLAHAGKSEFNGRNAVNFFSLGIEMEGDTKNAHQFTIAQLESMLEFMRPRIEKYGIPMDHITTHKIIREAYMKNHPDEKNVLTKSDLDDRVWDKIRDLIQKKLYPNELPKISEQGGKLIGAIAYRDTVRMKQSEDKYTARLGEMLQDFNAREQKREIEAWVKSFD